MLLAIPDVLTHDQVVFARQIFENAEWVDGRVTAGHQSALAKNNLQLTEGSEAARQVGEMILRALEQNPLFLSAARPARVFPPLFNLYRGGQSFGTHVDNAIRQVTGTCHRIRTDLSATLFFSAPEEYDGGELVVEDTYGTQRVKLPAGHMILYPATSLHHVNAGDAWGSHRFVFLDSEHDSRGCGPHAAVRFGFGDPIVECGGRSSGGGAADGRLP